MMDELLDSDSSWLAAMIGHVCSSNFISAASRGSGKRCRAPGLPWIRVRVRYLFRLGLPMGGDGGDGRGFGGSTIAGCDSFG